MKLGYLIPEFPGQTHAFFWREKTALENLDQEIFLLSTRKPPPDACHHAFAQRARKKTRYLFPPQWISSLLTLLFRPFKTLRAVAYILSLKETPWLKRTRYFGLLPCAAGLLEYALETRFDHIHCHSCADAAHLVCLTRILGGPPFSLTLHGDLPVYGRDHRRKMSRASFVSAVTEPLREQIRGKTSLAGERVPVIWMGVDTDRFRPHPDRPFRSRGLNMVTIARLNPAKGHTLALKAMKRAMDQGLDMTYRIAGDGPNRQVIEREIDKLGLNDQVYLLGSISEEQVLEILGTSDCFILPSIGLGEAAPVSVMEAMSCGLAVICSIIGGTGDMITDRVDGLLIEKGDLDGLTEAMTSLAMDPDQRKNLGQAARRRACDQFDYRLNAQRLLKAIHHQPPL